MSKQIHKEIHNHFPLPVWRWSPMPRNQHIKLAIPTDLNQIYNLTGKSQQWRRDHLSLDTCILFIHTKLDKEFGNE